MHIHVLGVCGTFMGSLAQLACEMGHKVTGSDENVYPPMSDQLRNAGIVLMEGYDPAHLEPEPDLVIIGNALSRGNPAVEYTLERGLRYTSGPQWLSEHVLHDRWVIAAAGTHGKTTTSSMVAWILEHAGLNPGFLIGGVPDNFSVSARLGDLPFFVVEADEYDTAFFDKRSKFVHYKPRTAILNNLEFDHADIFEDLAAIQKQFHHLMRTIPGNGCAIYPQGEAAIDEVLDMGCWSETCCFGPRQSISWQLLKQDGSHFQVLEAGDVIAEVEWSLTGMHNVKNGTAALLAARHAGVPIERGGQALSEFAGVKRRMELVGEVGQTRIYDDFAHHPTAIETTLAGIRKQVEAETVLAIIEPRSNTMRLGAHRDKLPRCVAEADQVIWYQPAGLDWSIEDVSSACEVPSMVCEHVDAIIDQVRKVHSCGAPLHVVIMSNGGFEGIHGKMLAALESIKG